MASAPNPNKVNFLFSLAIDIANVLIVTICDSHKDFDCIHGDVEGYYTQKVEAYGACALGVDWACTPTQELRFVQLLKLFDARAPFSVNDFGCGYGALHGFLGKRFGNMAIDYLGVDISPEMVRQARQLWTGNKLTHFVLGTSLPRVADYSLASGVFNVKLHHSHLLWTRYVKQTLEMLSQSSRRGFAVNFMSPVEGNSAKIEELYRTTEVVWRLYCQRVLGRSTQVLASYGMREFTLLVR